MAFFIVKTPVSTFFDTTSGLPSEDVVCLAYNGQQTVFAGFRPADICAINRLDGTHQTLLRPPVNSREIWTMYFDTLSGRLGCSSPLLFWKKAVGGYFFREARANSRKKDHFRSFGKFFLVKHDIWVLSDRPQSKYSQAIWRRRCHPRPNLLRYLRWGRQYLGNDD